MIYNVNNEACNIKILMKNFEFEFESFIKVLLILHGKC